MRVYARSTDNADRYENHCPKYHDQIHNKAGLHKQDIPIVLSIRYIFHKILSEADVDDIGKEDKYFISTEINISHENNANIILK